MSNNSTQVGLSAMALTMSSREIAELTEKQHGHVMRDIRVMLTELHGEGGVSKFGDTDRNEQNGQNYPIFRLPRRETMILMMGYSIPLRAKVHDRWEELETKNSRGVTVDDLLGNPKQLLALTQGYALQIEDMKRDMAVMQKDVDALDRIAGLEGNFGIRQSAKALSMPERKFVEYVQRIGWCFRQRGTNCLMGYADKDRAGLLTHKLDPYTKPDGSEGIRETLRFKPAGLVRLAKMLNVPLNLNEGMAQQAAA